MARIGNQARQQEPPGGDEHPWRETRDNLPADAKLRRYLFRIVSRPRNGPAIWERNGVRCTQEQAEQLAAAEGEDAEATETKGGKGKR